MIKDIYLRKKLASGWFYLLQQTICYELEKIEIDFAKKNKKKPIYFEKIVEVDKIVEVPVEKIVNKEVEVEKTNLFCKKKLEKI